MGNWTRLCRRAWKGQGYGTRLSIAWAILRFYGVLQGIDFLRPLITSEPLARVHATLRERCPSVDRDRSLAPDIERATTLVTDGSLARVLRNLPDLPALWIPA